MNIKRKYNQAQVAASMVMIMLLLWLTVSLPFVYAAQQRIASAERHAAPVAQPDEDSEDQSCNPFGNNTEEKAPSSVNTVNEEYLHHSDELFHAAELFLSHHHVHSVDEYISYHGEMLCPPPNFLS